MNRIIFHIDMNSYFATCEQQANPHLRGLPVGVCEHLGGIIIAPSIEAKRLGIKTGTPVWEAQKIYPDIVLLPTDPPKYRHTTRSFLKIFSDYTELIERASIDEAYLDVTHLIGATDRHPWSTALFYALEIKQRIRQEIGEWLSCCIGIGPNKLIAKIAADLDKPDGVFVVRPEEIYKLYELRLTDIPGIAKRMERQLNQIGIFSLRDLAVYPKIKLYERFGVIGEWLHRIGNFRDVFGLTTPQQETIKSMGHAYTMPSATRDIAVIRRLLLKLSEKVARRLRSHNYWGSCITCFVRYQGQDAGYAGEGKSHRIHDLINDGKIIFKEALKIYRTFPHDLPVRMAGVTVSRLVQNVCDEPLFERYRREQRAVRTMDRVNDKYGDFFLRRAYLTQARDLALDTVGFGRMKEMKYE